MKIKNILTPLLIILLLLSIVVMGAPTYVNVGPTTEFTGDVGVPSGSGYYINDVLFSTTGLIDISTLAKTDGGIIVGDGTNFVLETGMTARTSLGLGNVENLKVKLDGSAAPTINDDVDLGYAVGSRWVDITNDKEYVCLDNTDGAAVWTETTGAAGGYTNLTQFVDQTAWRLFYSNAAGDITELALGTDGQYLKSTGATSAPIFDTPTGAGDMLKATYDTDEDGDVDVVAGGTEKSAWTQYCIPYLSMTTAFGEIPIGTDNYALTVNGATGYDWTHLQVYDAGLLSLAGLTYVSDSFIKVTATDTYAIRTIAEVKTDLSIYSNLTSFVDQTAWRLFYSNTDGDVIELALGADGTYLGSNGATAAPTFKTPSGAGDMLKATYDIDEDGDVDVAAGGTEKSSWTQYCIPYLSDTTVFGEVLIGTAGQVLKVAAGATGYEWATLSYLANVVEDTTPELGGQLQAGAHSVNFTEQVLTSGTAIAWNLGNSNKATLTAAHNFTITITAPSGALNGQVIITQDGTGSRVMDEIVTQTDTAIATTDVHTDTEIIDLTVDIPTGARVRFKTTDTIPTGLVADTIYYAIRTSENHIQVATTKANAFVPTAIDITSQGVGTHTVQQLVKWTGGTLGVLSTTANSEDILSLTYKTGDKQWYAQLAKDFQ